MPVITPDDAAGVKRSCRKWQTLYPLQYIATCKRGCHGAPGDTYDDALKLQAGLEADCQRDRESDDDR